MILYAIYNKFKVSEIVQNRGQQSNLKFFLDIFLFSMSFTNRQ